MTTTLRCRLAATTVALFAGTGVLFAQDADDAAVQLPSVIEQSALRERALSILNEAAFSQSALLRANAIEGLHAVPTRAEEVIRAGLVDENFGVRYTAATSVGILKLYGSAEHVRPLLRDGEGVVRASAIFALSELGEEVDINPLARMLESKSAKTRSQVVWLLGEMGNPSAVPMLKDIADQKTWGTPLEDRIYRLQVAEALVKLDDREAVSSLRAALYPSSESEFEIAVLAAQIIGEIEDRAASAQLVTLIEARTADSNDRDPVWIYPAELRMAAASALAKLGYQDGGYVADGYMGDSRAELRAQSALVYAEIGSLVNLDKLEALLDDDSPLVQVHAATAILRIIES